LKRRPARKPRTRLEADRRRVWLYRVLAAFLLPAGFLCLLELALKLTGFGYPTSFFLRAEVGGIPSWIENRQFARRFFPAGLERVPGSFSIPINKPRDTRRIFVFGESAAQGDPQPMFGFHRFFRRVLEHRFPSNRFEVVNTAMTAINSHVILPIARDCATRQGDIWVIFMGNNEVVGPFGAGTVFGSRAPSLPLIRANLAIKQTRLGQGADSLVQRWFKSDQSALYWQGMELMAKQRVPQNAPLMTNVYAHFRRNLAEILEIGTKSGAAIVLCTVPVNLGDSPPFASIHAPDLAPDRQGSWERHYHAAITLAGQRQFSEALAQFREAEKIDSQFAALQFRMALCHRALNQADEARTSFQRAVDADALRFRADSVINRIIREVAAQFADRGVRLLDAEEEFARQDGIPGSELFLEHVHLTPKGNYLLAKLVAEEIERETTLRATATASVPPWLDEEECGKRIGYTPWNRARSLRLILDRFNFPPYLGTIGHADRVRALQAEVDRLNPFQTPTAYQSQARQVSATAELYPGDWELHENAGLLHSLAHDMPKAAAELGTAHRLMPHALGPAFSLAGVLSLQGRADEAIQLYRACLRLDPHSFEIPMRLGVIELSRRRFAEAIPSFRAALRAKPDSAAARIHLGAALFQAGQASEAGDLCREVLRLDPENIEARRLLQAIAGPKSGSRGN
jgi:tetratricopeptide (TPR) repeat protein